MWKKKPPKPRKPCVVALALLIVFVMGCASTPKVNKADPYVTAELAILTWVTAAPEEKGRILEYINAADKLVDASPLEALNQLVGKFQSMSRYSPLVIYSLQTLTTGMDSSKVNPQVQANLHSMFGRIRGFLGG